MAGSDKYEKAVGAVSRARGQEVTTTVGGDIEIQDGASFG